MNKTIYVVDAFTAEPFRGNPAGVCVLDSPAEEQWMQNVAAEMNLPETAFLHKTENGYSLRWFTPTDEVDLCGHATLASAFVLFATGQVSEDTVISFHTRSGELRALRAEKWIELDFPSEPPVQTDESRAELLEALGVDSLYIGKNRMDYVVEVSSEEEVRSLKPNLSLLTRIPARGIIVTSRSGDGSFDCISRCFFPAIGIDEDPVTGSAHCALAPYWSEKLGTHILRAYQASDRGGELQLELTGERVKLRGQAVIVMRNELLV